MPETTRGATGVRILRAAAVVIAMYALCNGGSAAADDWRMGVKQLTLRDPVGGGVMAGLVTYPTSAAPHEVSFGRFKIAAAPDAAPAMGQFPLIIFSHGTGGLPDLYLWLFEGLTANGFVVAGIAHPGDNYNDRSGSFGDALLVDRPRHISALIDGLEGDAMLGQAIDAGKIGIVGHSAGGYTAILSAGGVPDFSQFRAGRCRRNSEQDLGRPRMTHDPTKSPVADARIRAVAAIAPALGCLFDKDSLSKIRIPIRLYQADEDEILQPGFNATYFSTLLAPAPEVVRIAKAGHFVFLNTCPFIMSLIAREICSDPAAVNRDDVHRALIENISLFFRQSLDTPGP